MTLVVLHILGGSSLLLGNCHKSWQKAQEVSMVDTAGGHRLMNLDTSNWQMSQQIHA